LREFSGFGERWLPAATAATERVLDQRAQLVDELRCADEPDRRHRLAERHVLEQARQRDRAVARVIDHVQLFIIRREVTDLARGIEMEIARPRRGEPALGNLARLRPQSIGRALVVAEIERLEQPAIDEPGRQIA